MIRWAEILNAATTPISIAALSILVLSMVFSAALKLSGRRPSQLATRIVQYTLIVSLVTFIGGTAAFTITAIYQTEIRISGTVRDEAAEPIAGATVAVETGPSQDTGDNGSFELTIPRSRFASGVTIVVTDIQHEPQRQTRTTDLTAPFEFTLHAIPPNRRIIEGVDYLKVGQWLGNPWVNVGIVFNNKNPYSYILNAVTASIKSPTGTVNQIPFLQSNGTIPAAPANQLLRLRSNRLQRLDVEFYAPVARPDLIDEVNKVFAVRGIRAGSAGDPYFSPQLSSQLQNLARSGFQWNPGSWHIEICAYFDRGKDCELWQMSLTDPQVRAINGIIEQYPLGIGVIGAFRFSADPEGSGWVQVEAKGE